MSRVLLKVKTYDEALDAFKNFAQTMKRGDAPKDHFESEVSAYVLVNNDENYIDCEYESKHDGEIYSRAEMEQIA